MDIKNSADFILSPQRTAADMEHLYYISKNSFPAKAKGWVNGVYYPRKEQAIYLKNATLTCDGNCFIIPGFVWKETEETGFGVYPYEDTDVIHVPLENGNYEINITLTNPAHKPYQAFVKANNILKADAVEVGKEDVNISFFTSVIKDELCLKILPVSTETTREEAVLRNVYVKQIEIRRQTDKVNRVKPAIFLASDSTVQTYRKSEFPQTGWGQVLAQYFRKDDDTVQTDLESDQCVGAAVYETKEVIIYNRAIGGRSSKSFLMEGRLDNILEDLRPGDYVFVQFGHNDATAARPNRYVSEKEFAQYIQYYIDGVRQRKATCVLVTPVARRNCDEETGLFHISFNNYRKVMLDISMKQNIPLLDLGKESTQYLNSIGPEKSKELFLWTNPGDYPNSKYADGVSDNTHLQRKGAEVFAGIVARLIKEYDNDQQMDVLKKLLK